MGTFYPEKKIFFKHTDAVKFTEVSRCQLEMKEPPLSIEQKWFYNSIMAAWVLFAEIQNRNIPRMFF